MNIRKAFVLATLTMVGLPALAEFTTVTRAYEVDLADFRPPASQNGVAAFKACSDCRLQTVRVTPETRYVLNDRDVQLGKFRNALAAVVDRSRETVIVSHHLESDLITIISVAL